MTLIIIQTKIPMGRFVVLIIFLTIGHSFLFILIIKITANLISYVFNLSRNTKIFKKY